MWDVDTQAALVKMQGENGWQTKFAPDARALNKLGLGPGTAPASDVSSTHEAGEVHPDALSTFPVND